HDRHTLVARREVVDVVVEAAEAAILSRKARVDSSAAEQSHDGMLSRRAPVLAHVGDQRGAAVSASSGALGATAGTVAASSSVCSAARQHTAQTAAIRPCRHSSMT